MTASEMTCIVSGEALNSIHSPRKMRCYSSSGVRPQKKYVLIEKRSKTTLSLHR